MTPAIAIGCAVFVIYLSVALAFSVFQTARWLDGEVQSITVIDTDVNNPFVYFIVSSGTWLIFLFLIIPSMMFKSAGSKKSLIPDIILPATNSEKFCAKFFVYWLVPAVFAFCLMCISPYIVGHSEVEINGEMVKMATIYGYVSMPESILPSRLAQWGWIYGSYLFLSGAMILVSSFFHKKPLVATIITTLIIFVLVVIAGILLAPYLPHLSLNWFKERQLMIFLFQISLGVAMVAFCSLIAYKRFVRLSLNM